MHYISKWNWGQNWFVLAALALDSGIRSTKPSILISWRRQGFGRLVLIMLIKHSTSLSLSHNGLSHCQERLPGVDIYLHCPHKDPMAFYRACGFLQINLQDTTGFDLLPKTIADTLCDEDAQGFAWIVPESKEHCIIPLMQLCSGSLLNTLKEVVQDKKNKDLHANKDGGSGSLLNSSKEVVEIQNDLDNTSSDGGSSNLFLWCQYPPSLSDVKDAPVSALLTNVDMEEGYAGLDLLNKLLQPPLGLLVLLRRYNALENWYLMQGSIIAKVAVEHGWPQVSCR